MPYKPHKVEKLYYTISEVAKMFDVNTSRIRYYENNFDFLAPRKSERGTRLYTQEDIDNLKMIFHLVDQEGMTLKGARERLRAGRSEVSREVEIAERLERIKAALLEISRSL